MKNLIGLTLPEIAAWALPSYGLAPATSVRASLPALQRGAVWRPHQVEQLWDSLMRGLPIGAFLLAEFDQARGDRQILVGCGGNQSGNVTPTTTHHLLDGQQRSLAIALGYLDAWTHLEGDACRYALWIDLAPPAISDDRDFLFRMVTSSHPWGYKKTNPAERLSAHQCRDALKSYKNACPEDHRNQVDFRAGKLPLFYAWPYDAQAPAPVRFLLDASITSEPIAALKGKLAGLPIWRDNTTRQKIEERLDGNNHFIVSMLQKFRGLSEPSFNIPGIILPRLSHDKIMDQEEGLKLDPTETLFIRINSAGTPLTGEELNYSILKSAWPGCHDLVERLGAKRMAPSRLVALVTRLVLARHDLARHDATRPPAMLDVARFRRLISGNDQNYPNFKSDLIDFLESRAESLFRKSDDLLVYRADQKTRQFRLPPVLAAELSSSASMLDIYFLFLTWIDSKLDAWQPLSEIEHRRLIGAVTLLSWFGKSHKACLDALWRQPKAFFCPGQIRTCFALREDGNFKLVPVPPPDKLRAILSHVVTDAHGIQGYATQFWNTWNWWQNLSGTLGNDDDPRSWYRHAGNTPFGHNVEDRESKQLSAWTTFIDSLRGKRELVLFAQRHWMIKWFPDFDPAAADSLDDTNRPWDMDHIHPRNFIEGRHNIPLVLKDWHTSIGNLRIWPLELNRADQAATPAAKLNRPLAEDTGYGMQTSQELRDASFISGNQHLSFWENSTPPGAPPDKVPGQYLSNNGQDSYHKFRKNLLRAIVCRFENLYRHWYEELEIHSLVNPPRLS